METTVNEKIGAELDRLAAEEQVCILYACESGKAPPSKPSTVEPLDHAFLSCIAEVYGERIQPGG